MLVVDDDPAIRKMLAEVLTLEGYSVQTAVHGGPALDMMRTSPEPLVVTLGLMMPEVTGLDVLEAVVADPALAQRHMIMVVTGARQVATTGRVKEIREHLGASYVSKPFMWDQLLDAIRAAEQRLLRYSTAQTESSATDSTVVGLTHRANIAPQGQQEQLETDATKLTQAPEAAGLPERNATTSASGQTPLEHGAEGGQDGQHEQHGQGEEHSKGNQSESGSEPGSKDVHQLLTRAHTLMGQCQYEEALPLTLRAVELAPQSLKAWCDLGSNYGYLGRVAEVEQVFAQALRLAVTSEDKLWTWYYRGHAENNADAWESALQSFQRMAALEPTWGAPLLLQAMVLDNMGAFIDRHYYADVLVATDRALIFGGLRPVDECVLYQLKVSALVGLERQEEATYYQRRADELRRVERRDTKIPGDQPAHETL